MTVDQYYEKRFGEEPGEEKQFSGNAMCDFASKYLAYVATLVKQTE